MSITSFPSTLTWAAYLATSWTWCIGMFLPVLLVRDFGAWTFMAFALPNIFGAAAMGWFLRRPGASGAVVRDHAPALGAFSLATISFQAFFASHLMLESGLAVIIAGAITATTAIGAVLRTRPEVFASLAYTVSILCLALLPAGTLDFQPRPGDPLDALALTPGFVFGFLLCPYLDLTFHNARRALPGAPGTAAFILGFGGLFFLMILATLGYAGSLSRGELAGALAVHMAVQLAATMTLHQRALRDAPGGLPKRDGVLLALAVAVALLAAAMASLRWVAFEHAYYAYLGLYACVFPVYAWLCMIPHPRHPPGPTRRKLMLCTATAALVAPLFWLALVEGRTLAALPAAGILFASRLGLGLWPP